MEEVDGTEELAGGEEVESADGSEEAHQKVATPELAEDGGGSG